MQRTSDLEAPAIARVLFDLVDASVGGGRGASLRHCESFRDDDPGALDLGIAGANLDSIELLTAAGEVNEFFHLHETGLEEMLLRKRRLREWADIVRRALDEGVSGLLFETSGSAGVAKTIHHPWSTLEQETSFLAEEFSSRRRIISTVPAHHIYGFLFTVLLPARLGAVVRHMHWEQLDRLRKLAAPGDLVISHPTLWQYMSRSIGPWPANVEGVTSTAPLPAPLFRTLIASGLSRLVEVYGSTETGGVGLRDHCDAPFTLFPYYTAHTSSGAYERTERTVYAEESDDEGTEAPVLLRTLPGGEDEQVSLQDRLKWSDSRRFWPLGRKDRTVQVGGENVPLQRVEEVLAEHPGVQRVYVRPFESGGTMRLKAFCVLDSNALEHPDEAALRAHAEKRLKPSWRPLSIRFGETPPRNEMGKIVDWSAQ